MNWDNRSEWHIDHIIPISFGENKDEILMLNHYSNLRPMWSKDNISKGNSILYETYIYIKILETRLSYEKYKIM